MSGFRWIVLLALVACGAEQWELEEHIDDGEVCASRNAGGDAEFIVVVPGCMSSSCSRDLVGVCTATFDGTSLVLTSDISWENNVSPTASCTDDCGILMATCTVTGVLDGTYDVDFGGEVVSVTLPGEACDPFSL